MIRRAGRHGIAALLFLLLFSLTIQVSSAASSKAEEMQKHHGYDEGAVYFETYIHDSIKGTNTLYGKQKITFSSKKKDITRAEMMDKKTNWGLSISNVSGTGLVSLASNEISMYQQTYDPKDEWYKVYLYLTVPIKINIPAYYEFYGWGKDVGGDSASAAGHSSLADKLKSEHAQFNFNYLVDANKRTYAEDERNDNWWNYSAANKEQTISTYLTMNAAYASVRTAESKYRYSRSTMKYYIAKPVSTVTFDPNGGKVSQTSAKGMFGDKANFPTPTKDGYIFKGWIDGNGKPFTSYPAANATAYASWEDRYYVETPEVERVIVPKQKYKAKWEDVDLIDKATGETAAVDGYEVEYCKSADFKGALKKTLGPEDNEISIAAGDPENYHVRVRGFKSISGKKYYSGWSTAKDRVYITAFYETEEISAEEDEGRVTVEWEPNEHAGYQYLYKKANGKWVQIQRYAGHSDDMYVDTKVGEGKTYRYKVLFSFSGAVLNPDKYIRDIGKLVNDNHSISITTDVQKKDAPKITSAKFDSKGVFTLEWNKVKGATGYEYQISENADMSNAKKVTIKNVNTTKDTIKGLKDNVTYRVRIRSYVKGKTRTSFSSYSKKKKAVWKKPPVMGSIKNVKISGSGTTCKIYWSKSEPADGYEVTYSRNVLLLTPTEKVVKNYKNGKHRTELILKNRKQPGHFYAKVRAYKEYNGKKYYTKWEFSDHKPNSTTNETKITVSTGKNIRAGSKHLVGYRVHQGACCTDGKYIYMAFQATNGDQEGSGEAKTKIARISENGDIKAVSHAMDLGHANGMCYNTKTDEIVVTGAKGNHGYAVDKKVHVVNGKTLGYKRRQTVHGLPGDVRAFNAIAYDDENNRYIIRQRLGNRYFYVNSGFKVEKTKRWTRDYDGDAVQGGTQFNGGRYWLNAQAAGQSVNHNRISIVDLSNEKCEQRILLKWKEGHTNKYERKTWKHFELESLMIKDNTLIGTMHWKEDSKRSEGDKEKCAYIFTTKL